MAHRNLLVVPFLFVLAVLPLFSQNPAPATNVFVTHYDLQYRLDLEEGTLDSVAIMRVKNNGSTPVDHFPVLLYRLLTVTSVRDGTASASFVQKVASLDDQPTLQANVVTIQLKTPLRLAEERDVTISYRGYPLGYQEVMQYVRDRIDGDYSLLRNDSLVYPVVSEASFAAMIRALRPDFTYTVRTTVPPGYQVACGNSRIERAETARDSTVTCTDIARNNRIDVAVAKFAVAEDAPAHLRIFALPADAARANNMLSEMKRTIAFYTDYFGPMPGYSGYTVIEIPEGWGSQASHGYILQTAAAFRDPARISELYHEIGHTWNAHVSPDVQRARFFDEAFASYWQALAIRKFSGEAAYVAEMQRSRDTFRKRAANDARNSTTPIVDYGKLELGGNSYTKGAWALYVLHETIGEEAFRKSMRRMLSAHAESPIDFEKFFQILRQESGRNLDRYLKEWFYGTQSSDWLVGEGDIKTLAKSYR
jgi:aminopeptidase N